MARKSRKMLKHDRQRHLRTVQASDARKQNKGLVRIAVWVPRDEMERFKRATKLAVERQLVGEPEVCAMEIPKPWRAPKPRHDSRQAAFTL